MRARRAKSDRQSEILAELSRAPSLRVAELAAHLEVSTETIRRDLDELTEQGLLNRTYGGAVRPLSSEPSVSERHSLFIAERERIARAAVSLIGTGRVFIMGSGATTVHVARRMSLDLTSITVITHSFGVATVLSLNPTIKVIMLPGDYLASEGATVGVQTVSFLHSFYADFTLLGASGLTVEGPTDALIECGTVYGAMGRRAAKTLVVADHSKFDRTFPSRYLPWRDVDHLVTDAEPEGSLMSSLRLNEVAVAVG
ncbi:MAG: DeoR/GlpR family DNA-binding transcription regulator [Methyloceanibacter sp.]|jgi:DeoR/GlpR family transcriptional regulator of sugar metabolism